MRRRVAARSRWIPDTWSRTGRRQSDDSHSYSHFEKRLAMQLGKLGVWCSMDTMTAAAAAAFARRVEEWGYAALWIPESRGRNALAHSSWLLANTQRLIVATGIANIYARDPMAMAN